MTGMEFRKILALRGPNVWATSSVVEAWVDLGALEGAPPTALSGFNERLKEWLPALTEPRCTEGTCGGFVEESGQSAGLAQVLEHTARELQAQAGTAVSLSRTEATMVRGVYRVVMEYREEEVARGCLQAARDLILAGIDGRPFDVKAEVKRLRDLNYTIRLGPSTGAIAAAARKRGIPTRRLNKDSLVMLGHGARQKRINTAETSQTGAIAEAIAQDKELTRELLQQVGVPVPEGRPVADLDDAWEAAQEIGGPVVVKPRYGNHGRGVTTNLTTREQVAAAYANACEYTSHIVVERYAPGADFRLLVVGGRLAAAARREPAQVVGDGTRTVAQLVEEVNRDPRRSEGHSTVLSTIELDSIALITIAEQAFRADSVPPAGTTVIIRRNANLSTGGTATDVTDIVHPEVAARAIEAAQVVGLDIAGVDVIATDITRPLEEQAGVVVEVNAGPGLRMHLEPSAGKPRPVGEAIVSLLFPEGENGRIPIVAVTGVNGKTTVTRLVNRMLKLAGKVVGMTCTDGIYVDGRRIESGDCSGPRSAKAVLLNPKVEAAVLETARGGILREGLGYDACDVGIVTNIGEGDHLGLSEIESVEQLARVKRTVIESVAPWGAGVLKADDPHVAAMADHCPGTVTFFARADDDPVVAAHRARGGKAVFVRDGVLTLAEGDRETGLIPIARAALTHHGRVGFQVENVLAATAGAWALGLSFPTICEALLGFTSDLRTTPGRFNVLHHGGATVVVDYAHNPSAVLSLGEAIDHFPHERRSIVFTAAGDRRDVDIVRQGALLGDLMDHVIIYEDKCTRGRPDGEVVAHLRRGLAEGKRVTEIHETRGEKRAVEHALQGLKPGDLLVIQPDQVELILGFVQNYLENRPTWTEPEPVVGRMEAVSVVFAD
jgi:cyanophycin synthetase